MRIGIGKVLMQATCWLHFGGSAAPWRRNGEKDNHGPHSEGYFVVVACYTEAYT